MVCTSQKSRGCVLLLLCFTSLLLLARALSLQPTPTLSLLGFLTISTTTPPISKSTTPPLPHTTTYPTPPPPTTSTQTPTHPSVTPVTISSSTSPSTTTLYPTTSLSATSKTSLVAVPKIALPRLGKPAPRHSDPARTKLPRPLWPPKRPFPIHPPHTLKSSPPLSFSKTTPKRFQNPLNILIRYQKPPRLQTTSTSSPFPESTTSPSKTTTSPPSKTTTSPPSKTTTSPPSKTSPSPPSKTSPYPPSKTSPSPPSKTSPSVPLRKSRPHPPKAPKRPRKIPPPPVPQTSLPPFLSTSLSLKTSPSIPPKFSLLLLSKTAPPLPHRPHKHPKIFLPLTPKNLSSHSSTTSPPPPLTSTSSSSSPSLQTSPSPPPPQTASPRPARPPPLPHTSHPLFEGQPFTRPPWKTTPLYPYRPPKHPNKHLPLTPKTTQSSTTSPPPPLTSTFSSPPPHTSPSPPSPRTALPRPARPPPPLPPLPHTSHPLFERQPFMVSWNIPDLVCNRYNISLDTSSFKGVATPAKVPGQFLSLFYIDRLGLYPHVDPATWKQLYGGIPQRGNLKSSLTKARADINYYIPSSTRRGLAVIDWEEWRPLWVRNWGTKNIYKTLSVSHALQRNRSLSAQQAELQARKQFQAAARGFMSGKLSLGRSMRPNYLWGFYLFPNCYNHGWQEPGYTGRCSKDVRGQNDDLIWLWEASSALFPSVYLHTSLGNSRSAALMVRNRVQEALRVSALPRRSTTAPVFVYTRPVFIDQNRRFLSQEDLVNTIGESAAVGASGAVVWGASADYNDKASCEGLSSYLSSTLNPYITNLTAAAQLCSDFLCQGNGRCVRKHYDSDHHLHLSPGSFRITRVGSRHLVVGRPTFAELKLFSRRFTCQCYEGLTCAPRKYREIVKALTFRVKQGLYKKVKTLNKATMDNMEQSSIAKESVKKTLKV